MARSGDQQTAARPGLVIWITGLPGAGKTVIARALVKLLRSEQANSVIWLDGDELRSALGVGARYLPDERLALAHAYGRLCRLLASQDHTVVCSTVSMFDEVRQQNRSASRDYFEVFVHADDDVRLSRRPTISISRPHELVSAANGNYQLPRNPDLSIDNSGQRDPAELAWLIMHRLFRSGPS